MPHYENVPFEIPSSWEWTTLGEICFFENGYAFSSDDYTTSGIPLIRISNIKDNQISTENCVYIQGDYEDKFQICNGDLLIAMSGATTGKMGIYLSNKKAYLNQRVGNIKVIDTQSLCLEYRNLFLRSKSEEILKLAYGGAQPNISGAMISSLQAPLPPISEQYRIVIETERWFALIEQIEQGKADIQTAIKQTKSKILDLAIHGKLVPQDPNDEPASELLKRINPAAKITCDNGQYGKMPKGWCLVTGTSLFKQMKSAKPKGELFKYIDIDSIDNKSNIVSSIKEIPTIEAPSRASRYTEKGDVVFSMVRPYLRNIARITENDCIASTGFYICSSYNCMLSKFCYYLMLSNYVVDGLNTFMKGDNSPSITKREIENWLYPLPPMNEQYRIVAKIEEIFTILDRIELSLRMS